MDNTNNIIQLSQDLIDKYFKGWIGISVHISDDNNKEPSILMLDFNSHDKARSAYVFLQTWQNYIFKQYLKFSIVEEKDGSLTCYFYTPGFKYLKKANFRDNINIDKIQKFVQIQKIYSQYLVLARFVDSNYNVVDSVTTENFVALKTLQYRKREEIKTDDIEYKN